MNLSRKCLFFIFFYPNYISVINLYLNRNWNFQSFFIYFLLSSSLYTVEVEYLFKMCERERERDGVHVMIYIPLKAEMVMERHLSWQPFWPPQHTTHNTHFCQLQRKPNHHFLHFTNTHTYPFQYYWIVFIHIRWTHFIDLLSFFHFFKMGLINYRNKGIGKLENVEVE